tara:strand:+ start:1064 stop:1597 length:534 start_codon:yes stop_codon:yes gene_type:complete
MKKQKALKPTNEQIIFETIVYSTLTALQNHMLREGMITESNVKEADMRAELTVPIIQEVATLIPHIVGPYVRDALTPKPNLAGSGALAAKLAGDPGQDDLDVSGLSGDEVETIKTDYGLHPNTEKDEFGNFVSVNDTISSGEDTTDTTAHPGLDASDGSQIWNWFKKAAPYLTRKRF